jgi:hypothetical protein
LHEEEWMRFFPDFFAAIKNRAQCAGCSLTALTAAPRFPILLS